MFEGISWLQYALFLLVLTLIYYFVIGLVCFGDQLRFRQGKLSVQPPELKEEQRRTAENGDVMNVNDTTEKILHACLDELNAFFENQKKSKAVKSELMYSLYCILQKYPSLKASEYKDSLTNVIARQSDVICSIHLSAEELKGVWFG